ncbi:hypothetical protein [Streptomyces sp. NPDC012510]|uniref:hypothetical protein n=1 Tax=Streptomyces sp. NPDC012510 TaxID=3364838 RepID=UPI0036EB6D60
MPSRTTRTIGALTATGIALSAFAVGPAQASDQASDRAVTAPKVTAPKVAAAKGKVIRIKGKLPGCRAHAVVSVTKKTASGYARATCEYGSTHILVGLLSVNNDKLKSTTKRQRGGKTVTSKTLKLGNPKGTQKICMIGTWNYPLAEQPQYRSEARACVKY